MEELVKIEQKPIIPQERKEISNTPEMTTSPVRTSLLLKQL